MPASPARTAGLARHTAARRRLPAHGPRSARASRGTAGRPGPTAAAPRRPPVPRGAVHDQGNRSRPGYPVLRLGIGQQLDRSISIHDRRRLHGGCQQHAIGRLPELPGQGIGPAAGIDHDDFGPGHKRRQLGHQSIPGMFRRLVPADQFPRTGQDLHAGRAGLQDLGQRSRSGQRVGQRVSRLQAALQGHVAARRIAEQAGPFLLGQGHRQIHRDRCRAHASLAAKNHDPPRPRRRRGHQTMSAVAAWRTRARSSVA